MECLYIFQLRIFTAIFNESIGDITTNSYVLNSIAYFFQQCLYTFYINGDFNKAKWIDLHTHTKWKVKKFFKSLVDTHQYHFKMLMYLGKPWIQNSQFPIQLTVWVIWTKSHYKDSKMPDREENWLGNYTRFFSINELMCINNKFVTCW